MEIKIIVLKTCRKDPRPMVVFPEGISTGSPSSRGASLIPDMMEILDNTFNKIQ